MKHKKAHRITLALRPHSDHDRRGRPGIKGTQPKLDETVQALLAAHEIDAAVRLIEAKIREAYGCWEAA